MAGLVWASWLRRDPRVAITVWVPLRGRGLSEMSVFPKVKEGEKRQEEVTGRKVGRWWKGRERETGIGQPLQSADSTRE